MNSAFAVPPVLYGTVGHGHLPVLNSTLLIIDQSTGGLQQTIGSVGHLVNGLAFDPTTGILYGSTAYNDTSPNSLITIDTSTGAGTVIAPFGVPVGTDTIIAITFDSTGQMDGSKHSLT